MLLKLLKFLSILDSKVSASIIKRLYFFLHFLSSFCISFVFSCLHKFANVSLDFPLTPPSI